MLLFLLALSCIIRNREKEKETMGEEHFRLIRLWNQGDIEGVEKILETKKNEENTQSFWVLATQLYGKKGREEFSEEYLKRSKDYGFRCLSYEPQFVSILALHQGMITVQAIETLDGANEAIVECVLWTSISWSLWLHEREGLMIASDVQTTQMMADWAFSHRQDAWTSYAVAISTALTPIQNSPDWKKIAEYFEKAQKLDPLTEFEYYYHHHRFIEPQTYCQKQDWNFKNESHSKWEKRWKESLWVCSIEISIETSTEATN